MMVYTTDTGTARLWEARKPPVRRPIDNRLAEQLARAEDRLAQVRRPMALPVAAR